MNDPIRGGDPLEELLARPPYLDDAGFTDRVMDRLPPRRSGLRAPVLLAGAAAAGAVAAALLPQAVAPAAEILRAWRPGEGLPGAALGGLAALAAVFWACLSVALDE